MKFLNSNYGNDGYNYADFAVKRTKTKGTRTSNPNPFASTAGEGKYTGTKTYGKELGERIKEGRTGMSQLPASEQITNIKKKPTKGTVALKNAGRFIKKNKIGLGLAAAGALGAVGYGAYRKMRSDKGRKRGQYSK